MTDTKTIEVDMQGYKANKSGKWLENQVESEFAKYGIKAIKYSEFDTKKGKKILASCKSGFLLKNVPYINMFGSNAYGEFVLCLFGRDPIRLECRNQDVSGSIQDKLPKLLGDCIVMQEHTSIIVLEGDGVSANAREWLVSSAKAVQHKHIRVKTLNEFKVWARKLLTKKFKVPVTYNLNSVVKGVFNSIQTKKVIKTLPNKQL